MVTMGLAILYLAFHVQLDVLAVHQLVHVVSVRLDSQIRQYVPLAV